MKSIVRNHKKLLVANIILILIAIGIAFWVLTEPYATYANGKVVNHPYAMKVDGKEVVLVKNKAVSDAVLDRVAQSYVAKGTKFKSVSYDKKITSSEKELERFQDPPRVSTTEEAVSAIQEANQSEEPLFTATVVSEKTKSQTVAPKVIFKKDSSMAMYEAKVVTEGKPGKQDVTYEITTENGKKTGKKKVKTVVTTKVTDAVVKTGLPELPKKLMWKDYDAFAEEMTAASEGEGMVKYGKNFLGNPYKYGGHSLTNGIDCVQFVRQMYAKYGKSLPNSLRGLGSYGHSVSLANAKPGDIVYYGSHVALYMGNGKVIHAIHRGISISDVHCKKIRDIRRG